MLDKSIRDKNISHGEILKKVWRNLDLGVIDRKHPFHLPVFGTVDGDAPSLRTVVLRRFWRKPAQLAFHSHLGSPKVSQINANPNVYWLFYNSEERLQVRIKGTASIHQNDELTDEQWQATELFSRRCYIGEAPTQESKKPTTGLPDDLNCRKPTPEESEHGKENFVVIVSTIDEIDCMELDRRGHRRSLFKWNADGEIEMKWLTP